MNTLFDFDESQEVAKISPDKLTKKQAQAELERLASEIAKNDKTLLIYCAGGMGDKIMHSRFIPIICEKAKENNNKVIFLVDDLLGWLFDSMFEHISNLNIIEMSYRDHIPHFDRHINLTLLFMYMGYDDKTIPPPYAKCHFASTIVFQSLCPSISRELKHLVSEV